MWNPKHDATQNRGEMKFYFSRFSAIFREPARNWRDTFIAASAPETAMQPIPEFLRSLTSNLTISPDLTPLARGEADYAVVVEWAYSLRLDLLKTYDRWPVENDALRQQATRTLAQLLARPEDAADRRLSAMSGAEIYYANGSLGVETLTFHVIDKQGNLLYSNNIYSMQTTKSKDPEGGCSTDHVAACAYIEKVGNFYDKMRSVRVQKLAAIK